jgi:hypothetical protein
MSEIKDYNVTTHRGYKHIADLPAGDWRLIEVDIGAIAVCATHPPILFRPDGTHYIISEDDKMKYVRDNLDSEILCIRKEE